MPAVSALLLSAFLLASTVTGSGEGQAFTVTPNPAPAGATVTLTGGCPSTAASFPISLFDPDGNTIASGNASTDGLGDFTGTLQVPADATPGGGYGAVVQCNDKEELVTRFSVIADPGATPPTTAPPTEVPPQAQPADANAVAPAFTG